MLTESEQYYSPEKLAERLESFTLRQIRWHLFNRKQNGLDRYVRRIGKRLYLRESDWNQWVDEQVED